MGMNGTTAPLLYDVNNEVTRQRPKVANHIVFEEYDSFGCITEKVSRPLSFAVLVDGQYETHEILFK